MNDIHFDKADAILVANKKGRNLFLFSIPFYATDDKGNVVKHEDSKLPVQLPIPARYRPIGATSLDSQRAEFLDTLPVLMDEIVLPALRAAYPNAGEVLDVMPSDVLITTGRGILRIDCAGLDNAAGILIEKPSATKKATEVNNTVDTVKNGFTDAQVLGALLTKMARLTNPTAPDITPDDAVAMLATVRKELEDAAIAAALEAQKQAREAKMRAREEMAARLAEIEQEAARLRAAMGAR